MGLISFQDWEPPHVSYSTISSYRMCGRKTLFEKVMRLEQKPGLAAIGGNAVHVATEQIDHLIYEQDWDALDAAPPAPVIAEPKAEPPAPPAVQPLDAPF